MIKEINRPVKFTFYDDVNGGKYANPPLTGILRIYFDDPIYKDEKYLSHTWALIEDDKGKTYKVPLDKFDFTDRS